MAYFLFVDESGQDQHESPYEVLAGIAIRDIDLWPPIKNVTALEIRHFGRRYSDGASELKAKKILKRKTYRQAALRAPFDEATRTALAKPCLDDGAHATPEMITALAQAKIAFARDVLQACAQSRARVFATMVPRRAPRSGTDALRKDYAYLSERFSYFLEHGGSDDQGIVVFDELERYRSHVLIHQMRRYFIDTRTGQRRSTWIIPEPVFVHSDLTTGVQLADLVAYIVSWNICFGGTDPTRREELDPLGEVVREMHYLAQRDIAGKPEFGVWSITVIPDPRTRVEWDPENRERQCRPKPAKPPPTTIAGRRSVA